MRHASSLLLVLALAFTPAMHPQHGESAPEPAHRFTAQWITADGAPSHDPAVLRLREEILLGKKPSHFVVHVSADNQFLLLVNG